MPDDAGLDHRVVSLPIRPGHTAKDPLQNPEGWNKMKPYAIVIGLDSFTGVQTARLLAGRSVPVIGIASDPGHFCCKTRVCERQIYTDTAGEPLVHTLANLGPKLKHRAVLYPCNDLSVSVLSMHRSVLHEWYHIALPTHETVELLMDKVRFLKFARHAGLPVPPTYFLHSRTEALQAAEQLRYPCILKPARKSQKWEKQTRDKAFKVPDKAMFLALYDKYADLSDMLMAQQWVPGSDADLYSCNVYFNQRAEHVASFVARKLRQWPPEAGTSCLGEEVRNETVRETTIRLFSQVQYQGLGYVEMKKDRTTGEHYIIEPNVGRPTGRSAIAEAGGVELLYAMYCDRTGLPLPANLQQRYTGVKWVYLRRDLQSALYYWRRGDLTLREWVRSLRGKKMYALFSWRDPGPFLGDLSRVIRLALGRKREKRTAAKLSAQRKAVESFG